RRATRPRLHVGAPVATAPRRHRCARPALVRRGRAPGAACRGRGCMRARPLLLALVAPLLLGACSYFRGQAAPYRPAGGLGSPAPAAPAARGPAEGLQLYQRDCAWCHGSRGQGTSYGPNLLQGTAGPAATDLML